MGASGHETIRCASMYAFSALVILAVVTSQREAAAFKLGKTLTSHLPRPATPTWPDKFTSQFYIYVEQYGENWKSIGAIYYDWTIKSFRGDFIDWCLPLFDSGSGKYNNYSCTFLAIKDNMYFVNHTGSNWEENDCCLFEKGLGALPPDWMKIGDYNGTDTIKDILVDTWWFPGTNDPNKPCYGYWNAKDNIHTPVQFFGLTDLGPTILDYYNFKPNYIPSSISFNMPDTDCNRKCVPPSNVSKLMWKDSDFQVKWPMKWPSCE